MLALMALRVPIWVAMFVPGAVGYVVLAGGDALLAYLKGIVFARFSIYDLSVIPLFLLMGQLATAGRPVARAVSRGGELRRPLARRAGAGRGAGQRGIRLGLRLVGRDGGDDRAGGVAGDAALPVRRRLRDRRRWRPAERWAS